MKRGRGRGWEEVGGGWLLPLPLTPLLLPLFPLPLLPLPLLPPPLPVATGPSSLSHSVVRTPHMRVCGCAGPRYLVLCTPAFGSIRSPSPSLVRARSRLVVRTHPLRVCGCAGPRCLVLHGPTFTSIRSPSCSPPLVHAHSPAHSHSVVRTPPLRICARLPSFTAWSCTGPRPACSHSCWPPRFLVSYPLCL
jgi:hypothetical protein